ncbi:hypothetical protein ACFL1H_00940 [Nanoarchaeota archaeon]
MNKEQMEVDLVQFKHKTSNLLNRLGSQLCKNSKKRHTVMSIFFCSEIKSKDNEFLKNFLKNAKIPKKKGAIIIHGPGGNTLEAIKIGLTLREHFNTDLKIMIPKIAGSAMVYITLFANQIIIPTKNAYLTTINSTVYSQDEKYGLRLIPNNLLVKTVEEKDYSVAECNRNASEGFNKILNEGQVSVERYNKLIKIKELLKKILWKCAGFPKDTTGNMVEKLFLEERDLHHEFLDFNELKKRGFPISNVKCNTNIEKTLKQIYDQTTSQMEKHDIVFLIHYDTKIACKWSERIS